MAKYKIYYNPGNGYCTDMVEVDNKEEALKIAEERWRESVLMNPDYYIRSAEDGEDEGEYIYDF